MSSASADGFCQGFPYKIDKELRFVKSADKNRDEADDMTIAIDVKSEDSAIIHGVPYKNGRKK